MQQHIFSFVSELDELHNSTHKPASSHCSSVQERLGNYGSEALDTAEHLGLILGSQKQAAILFKHFGSLTVLARASVQELLPFVSRSKALRLVSSLRMGAVALREERQSLIIDSPLAIADLCSEMRFLDRESLRVVLLNAKRHLIKVATVSQGTLNEAPAHPREILKPVITHSAYSFILVHNHPSGDPSPSEADLRLTRRIKEASRVLELNLIDHVIIGSPAPGRSSYFMLLQKIAAGETEAQRLEAYPQLSKADLTAVLEYAARGLRGGCQWIARQLVADAERFARERGTGMENEWSRAEFGTSRRGTGGELRSG